MLLLIGAFSIRKHNIYYQTLNDLLCFAHFYQKYCEKNVLFIKCLRFVKKFPGGCMSTIQAADAPNYSVPQTVDLEDAPQVEQLDEGKPLNHSASTDTMRVADTIASHVASFFNFLLFQVPIACWSTLKQVTMFPFWSSAYLVRFITYPFWVNTLTDLEAKAKAKADAALVKQLERSRDQVQTLEKELEQSQNTVQVLEQKLAKYQDTGQTLEKELAKYKDKAQILAEELQKSQNRAQALAEKSAKYQFRAEKAESVFDILGIVERKPGKSQNIQDLTAILKEELETAQI